MVQLLALVALMADQSKVTLPLEGGLTLGGESARLMPAKGKPIVLVFVAADCPVANRYAPEIERIHEEYRARGVIFRAVYLLGPDRASLVTVHQKEYRVTIPAILDPNRSLVKQVGATVTPEAAIINEKGEIIYRGRIDDRNVDHGRVKQGYRRDLRMALDETLAGKPVSLPRTAPVGCFISGG